MFRAEFYSTEKVGGVMRDFEDRETAAIQKSPNTGDGPDSNTTVCWRTIVGSLFVLILSSVLIVTSASARANHRKALTKADLLHLLAGHVYSERIAAFVKERGLAFSPTSSDLHVLYRAGATRFLLRTVKRARVRPPEYAISRTTRTPLAKQADLGERILPTSATANSQVLEPSLPVKITVQNWEKYRNDMPAGMIRLFEGKDFWKMPNDVEIDVGPMVSEHPPAGYLKATEEYSRQVRVVHLADGHNDLSNYVGGEPFPKPQDPDRGYKLLVDLWFAYVPHIAEGGLRNPLNTCTQDRLGNINCLQLSYVYRQTAYNTDPDAPTNELPSSGTWYTEWLMIEQPEQARYTTQLTLFFKNNQRTEDLYTFTPSLRRVIRGSLASRCSPVAGTDYLEDDYKSVGFNGGIGDFDARFLSHMKILALSGDYLPLGGDFPSNYYMPLGWPRPSWGTWQFRDVDVIAVRRVPREYANYCYGSRIIYEDSQTHYALWEDAYDSNMRLWKSALVAQRRIFSTGVGYVFGPVSSSVWDLQNEHMTNVSTEDKFGHDMLADYDVPLEYRDLNTYSTASGLSGIMK